MWAKVTHFFRPHSHEAADKVDAAMESSAEEMRALWISLAVLRQAAREVYRRLMDAVDPALLDQAEATLRATEGVLDAGQVRMRWIGHQLRAECEVIVDGASSAVAAHKVAVDSEHALIHAIPRLSAALVHADPQAHDGLDHHAPLASHR